ncbi:MAG TPA: hypothetical protein VFI23_15465 [Rhizomicrobium sp.]|nr:hypothetical protein [Rhizomicrobium sp.]
MSSLTKPAHFTLHPLTRAGGIVVRVARKLGFGLMQPYYAARRDRRRARLGAIEKDKSPVILFLAAEAGLTQYFAGHALLAKTLNEAGHPSMVLSCGGALPHCNVKSANQDTSNRVCIRCRRAALVLGDKYDLPDIALESLIGETENAEIRRLLAEAKGGPAALQYEGIAFGEFALGESLRARRKLSVSEFTAEDNADLLATVTSALKVYFAVKKLAARFTITRIVYYGAYAHWLPTVVYARHHNIAATQIEHGYNRDVDRRLLNLRPAPVHEQQMIQIQRWNEYRDIPLDPATVRLVAEAGLFRLSNHGMRSTHSPNFTWGQVALLEQLGLSPAKKTLVAYSSNADELFAARHIYRGLGLDYGNQAGPFQDSNDWLASLISWAGTQPDLQLIVRLHPRLATPEGKPLSPEEQSLRALLTAIPDNVRIIWPRDKTSSYNLAEVADLALVSWSTIGLELARFGVPVIAAFADRGSFAVGSFIGFENTAERYFAAVRAALCRPGSYAQITEAMRWTHYLFLSPTVDFSDCVPSDDFTGAPDWTMPADRNKILRTLIDGEDRSDQRMAELRSSAVADEEYAAVRRALEYYIIFFMTGRDLPSARIEAVTALQNHAVSLTVGGQTHLRHSPLAHRLAMLWAETTHIAEPQTLAPV